MIRHLRVGVLLVITPALGGGCYVGIDGDKDPTQASAPSEGSGSSASASEGTASASASTTEAESDGEAESSGVDPSDATGDPSTGEPSTGDPSTGDPTTSTSTTGEPTTSTSTSTTGDPTTSTSSGSTTSGSTTSGSTGGSTGGDDWDGLAQFCVDEINMYRATLGLPPYARWAAAEMCSDGEAESDALTNTPHGAFGMCGEWAQNECPGWPAGDLQGSLAGCLAQMWAEGPGEDFQMHGHYLNMSSTQYDKVACGFHVTAGNKLWAVQNFQ